MSDLFKKLDIDYSCVFCGDTKLETVYRDQEKESIMVHCAKCKEERFIMNEKTRKSLIKAILSEEEESIKCANEIMNDLIKVMDMKSAIKKKKERPFNSEDLPVSLKISMAARNNIYIDQIGQHSMEYGVCYSVGRQKIWLTTNASWVQRCKLMTFLTDRFGQTDNTYGAY